MSKQTQQELLKEIRNMAIINFAEIQILKKALFEKLGIALDPYEFRNELKDIIANLHSNSHALVRDFPHLMPQE